MSGLPLLTTSLQFLVLSASFNSSILQVMVSSMVFTNSAGRREALNVTAYQATRLSAISSLKF